jgi:hypothetical protein
MASTATNFPKQELEQYIAHVQHTHMCVYAKPHADKARRDMIAAPSTYICDLSLWRKSSAKDKMKIVQDLFEQTRLKYC